MGRMLKNASVKTASHSLAIPVGTSSIGPDSPVAGQTRYNTTTGKLEFYNNAVWNAVAREGNVSASTQSFTAGPLGNQTEFGPMTYSYASAQESQVLVHVGTVYQIPVTNYTFYGNAVIHFVSAPSGNSAITLVHGLASTTAA
jgi:hypothetical protein